MEYHENNINLGSQIGMDQKMFPVIKVPFYKNKPTNKCNQWYQCENQYTWVVREYRKYIVISIYMSVFRCYFNKERTKC